MESKFAYFPLSALTFSLALLFAKLIRIKSSTFLLAKLFIQGDNSYQKKYYAEFRASFHKTTKKKRLQHGNYRNEL